MSTSSTRNRYFLYFTLLLLSMSFWILNESLRSESTGSSCTVIKQIITSGDHNHHLTHRLELEDLDGLQQDDPSLIQYLRQFHVYPPSKRGYRYSTLDDNRLFYINDSRSVTKIIQGYLKNMTNGIFVEAGANNGADELSNTLVLERDYNWTGLLVEGSPLIFPKLLSAHRKSWKSDLLLSKYPHTKLVLFNQGPNVYAGKEDRRRRDGGPTWAPPPPEDAAVAVVAEDGKTPLYYYDLLTVPLYSLIAACNFHTIDYLSLDVEGTESEILMNFPFDKVLIRTMIVEANIMRGNKTRELAKFLFKKGYFVHPTVPTARDLIFVHKSVISKSKRRRN